MNEKYKYAVKVKARCIILVAEDGDQFPIVVTGKEASECLSFISQIPFNDGKVQKEVKGSISGQKA